MSRNIRSTFVCLAFVLLATAKVSAFEITPAGERLAHYFDGLDVEHHWLSGEPVHWRLGEPNPGAGKGATHCSAFVAAACAGLDVYILRPPEHKQTLLANAQFEWLAAKGADQGWRRVASPAQRLANQGELVVATCENPDHEKPGHVALVRPSHKPAQAIASEGPDVIQAGGHNHNRATIVDGFRSHPAARRNGEILFDAHPATVN